MSHPLPLVVEIPLLSPSFWHTSLKAFPAEQTEMQFLKWWQMHSHKFTLTQTQSCLLSSENALIEAGRGANLSILPLPVFTCFWHRWYWKLGGCFLMQTGPTEAPFVTRVLSCDSLLLLTCLIPPETQSRYLKSDYLLKIKNCTADFSKSYPGIPSSL